MIHTALMCASVSASRLSEVVNDVVRAVLPPAIAHGFIDAAAAAGHMSMSIPSAPTVSRHRLTLHLSFMLHLRQLNDQLLADIDGLPARYHTADSSPQGGREWFLSGAVVVPAGSLKQAFAAAATLCAHPEDSPQAQAAVSLLQSALQRRPCCPVSIGSARASVFHKMHAQLHSLRIEHRSWSQVAAAIQSTVSWLTDFGTEAGLANAPCFRISQLFPWVVEFEHADSDLEGWVAGAGNLEEETTIEFQDADSGGEACSIDNIQFDNPSDSAPESEEGSLHDIPHRHPSLGPGVREGEVVVDWSMCLHVPGLLHISTI